MTAPGSYLNEVIRYFRQYVKEGDQATLPDITCINFINRFYINRMPYRLQSWDLKRQFYLDVAKDQNYYYFPKYKYQRIIPPLYIDGIEFGYYQSEVEFYRNFPEQVFNETPLSGADGTGFFFEWTLSNTPIMKSFYDKPNPNPDTGFDRYLIPNLIISAQDEDGVTQYIVDDGEGNLNQMEDGELQNILVDNIGTVDYQTGELEFSFFLAIPDENPITIQSIPYQRNKPVASLFTDNYIKVYPVPDRAYRISYIAEITPAQFLTTLDDDDNLNPDPDSQLLAFSYQSEYIGLGAAIMYMWSMRKEDQLRFYLPYFKEIENELLRRTTRQEGTQRAPTIFTAQPGNYGTNYYNYW